MDFDLYDDEPRRRWKLVAAGVGVLVLLATVAFWQLRPNADDSGASDTVSNADSGAPSASESKADVTTTQAGSSPLSDFPAVTTTPPTTRPMSDATIATTVPTTDVPESSSTTSGVPETSVADVPPVMTNAPVGYPTGPDGLPLPLVVIFDTETITISGQVPSQAARERLAGLAVANSQFPDAQVIDNMVINSSVPISVGVRVIELNSARFPEETAEILPEHALELDRVVGIMQALPNISVVVVGHADQRGDDLNNFAVSDARARAVVNYLLYLGVAPSRLSSRAAGESDLLSGGDDLVALALNRRTEFVFSGLLIE